MAQARSKSQKKKPPVRSAPLNGPPATAPELLTLPEAAAYLRVTESELLRLVDDQALPGRQFGNQWRFLKAAIQEWLRTRPKRGSREAVLSVVGAWKDDPCVMEELEEIYRKRREDPIGGGE